MKFSPRIRIGCFGRSKTCGTNENLVREWSRSLLALCVNAMADRAALHEDDRMMAVLASNRRGQTGDEFRFGSPCHQLEAMGGKMVAFIDDQMPITANAIIYHSLANKTLDQCHIQRSSQLFPPAAEAADGFAGQTKKRR